MGTRWGDDAGGEAPCFAHLLDEDGRMPERPPEVRDDAAATESETAAPE